MAGAGAISAPGIGFSGVAGAGAMDAGGAAGAAGAAGSAGAAGAAGPLGAAGGAVFSANGLNLAMSSASMQQMQQLVQLLKDFTSADILLALMLMRASDKKDHCGAASDGGALLGMLAGLALGTQVHQTSGNLQNGVPKVGHASPTGGVGGQMNVQV